MYITDSLVLCRVVQKNLVFVIGLSPRMAEGDVLRKQEYFGRFGKIVKVVINNHTVYTGNQVRSCKYPVCSIVCDMYVCTCIVSVLCFYSVSKYSICVSELLYYSVCMYNFSHDIHVYTIYCYICMVYCHVCTVHCYVCMVYCHVYVCMVYCHVYVCMVYCYVHVCMVYCYVCTVYCYVCTYHILLCMYSILLCMYSILLRMYGILLCMYSTLLSVLCMYSTLLSVLCTYSVTRLIYRRLIGQTVYYATIFWHEFISMGKVYAYCANRQIRHPPCFFGSISTFSTR